MAGMLEITTLFGTVYYAGMEVNPKDKRKKPPHLCQPQRLLDWEALLAGFVQHADRNEDDGKENRP